MKKLVFFSIKTIIILITICVASQEHNQAANNFFQSKVPIAAAQKPLINNSEIIDHIKKEKEYISCYYKSVIIDCQNAELIFQNKLENQYELLKHTINNVIELVMSSNEFIANTEQITNYQAKKIYLSGLKFNDIPPYNPGNYSTDDLINQQLLTAFGQKLNNEINELFTILYIKKTVEYGAKKLIEKLTTIEISLREKPNN